ncbi:hypothetical protein CEY12_22075 [Chryseobacterium sp. T16E-39]|uniref:DoxX family protein n=1 Tax=Chryseobacterium sp. T16E-39 TaxID=2015076 RepID=UPI000B5B0ED5|nr:DoxX family membrane protein [Chryseobacterium sp. T16E-39]ASK32606.1 hypothetical protein CEY12_22075 [Chryseobacterium sp. T16E-39]
MPESILPIVFVISLIILKITTKKYDFSLSGRIAMMVMLITTGIAHFVYAEGMALMLPEWIPFKQTLIFATGILEIVAGILLLIPKYQKWVGWGIILFFILIVPANIYAAIKHVNMQSAGYDGKGAAYLFYRIPLQVIFIGWVYFSAIKWPFKWGVGKHRNETYHINL